VTGPSLWAPLSALPDACKQPHHWTLVERADQPAYASILALTERGGDMAATAGRTPQEVFQHRAVVLVAGDLDGSVSDYADDAS
jgi:hypothetical protein